MKQNECFGKQSVTKTYIIVCCSIWDAFIHSHVSLELYLTGCHIMPYARPFEIWYGLSPLQFPFFSVLRLALSLIFINANADAGWYSFMWPLMHFLSQSVSKSKLYMYNSPSHQLLLMKANAFLVFIETWLIPHRDLWWQLDVPYLFFKNPEFWWIRLCRKSIWNASALLSLYIPVLGRGFLHSQWCCAVSSKAVSFLWLLWRGQQLLGSF